MWKSDRKLAMEAENAKAVEQQGPPKARGIPLASFDRNRGEEQLRIAVDSYQGHAYVSVRCWSRGQGNEYYPTARGLSIKLRELEGVRAALSAESIDSAIARLELLEREADQQPAAAIDPDRPTLCDRRPRHPARDLAPYEVDSPVSPDGLRFGAAPRDFDEFDPT